MVVNEGLILEIVAQGTDMPLKAGKVGEIVITRLNVDYPLLRVATGDLSMILPDPSPCGRTNIRIKGWMGHTNEAVRFADRVILPGHVIDIGAHHSAVRKLRLTVRRDKTCDLVVLHAETSKSDWGLANDLKATLKAVIGIEGRVEIVSPGDLPDDGKFISDERGRL
jgi:phenylacetate-CoA ligase